MTSSDKLLNLKEYKEKLSNDTYAIRMGKEVPEGDVNIAYIHTPRIDSDENISLIDTSSIPDNVIPDEQLESIVAPDRQGKLSYINIISEIDAVKLKAPYSVFPSKHIALTREFKKNEHKTNSALYYKFELMYHYDSKQGIPGKVEKYRGQQIELTDEHGSPLDERFKYEIYVMAMEGNPQIHRVKVYLHVNTDTEETFKVRYNHIDSIVENSKVHSKRESIQLYTNKGNQIKVDGESLHLLEGGKLRVINGESAFKEVNDMIFDASDEDDEVYRIEENPSTGGYDIYVPQKSEIDPRAFKMFNYRVVASYMEDGRQQRVTSGYVNDWVINKDALLDFEKLEYAQDWKNIGMPAGGSKLKPHEMIELSLPMTTASIPETAAYEIFDASGNLLYTTIESPDHVNVFSRIAEMRDFAAEAKAVDVNVIPWKNALQKNTRVTSTPIQHTASIIAERQITKWTFDWTAIGEGEIHNKTAYTADWWVCGTVGVYKSYSQSALDVVNKNKWEVVGTAVTTTDWKVKTHPDGINYIELQKNEVDVAGFYQKVDRYGQTMSNKTDYEFSAKVKVVDPGDDDVIGIMFRVKDKNNYYMFAWEKELLMSEPYIYQDADFPPDHGLSDATVQSMKTSGNGVGRIEIGSGGVQALSYRPTFVYSDPKTATEEQIFNDWNQYAARGFGTSKKRIFKATPRPASTPRFIGYSSYSDDETGNTYEDVTTKGSLSDSSIGKKGWELNKEYKITVVVTGNLYRVYISEAPDADSKGTLVCEAIDSTHTSGSVGIFCSSQRWTQWRDLVYNELDVAEVCSDPFSTVFEDSLQKKISDKRVPEIIGDKIDKYAQETYNTNKYILFGYTAKSSKADVYLDIDEGGVGYVWGSTDNPTAGGTQIIPWNTNDNGLNETGTGYIEYHEDGHFTKLSNPEKLSRVNIPDNIVNFKWNNPVVTVGENVSLTLGADGETILIHPVVPKITQLGTWYTLPTSKILKEEGIKSIGKVFGQGGVYEKLNIPVDIPLEQILLRIERGTATGPFTTTEAEHRVNYRFRWFENGLVRMPVDQFQDQLGVNRLRLSSIFTGFSGVEDTIDYVDNLDLVAWTHYQDLEAVPIFAIKVEGDKKFEIEKPKVVNHNMEIDNWYVRVKDGKMQKRITLPYFEAQEKVPQIYKAYPELLSHAPTSTMIEKEVIMEFLLPEYNYQEFYDRPTILVERERPIILNEYAIQTAFAPIDLVSDKGISYLEVEGIRQKNARKLRVADVDAAKGIIYLHDRIREQDEILIRYAYVEDWYTYRGFEKEKPSTVTTQGTYHLRDEDESDDLKNVTQVEESNPYIEPVIDNSIPRDFFHLDLNPSPGHMYTVAQDDFFSWIPLDIDSSSSYVATEQPSNELLVKAIHVYLRPAVIRDASGLIIEGTQRAKVIFHTDEERWFNERDYNYDPSMFRLAKIMVQANADMKKDMVVLDTRTRGGGLDEALSKEVIKKVNKESLYHWDIGFFDGEAYQENGVMIVRLPNTILDQFHESEVQAAVARHKAYGVLPIIEYYDPSKMNQSRYSLLLNPEFYNGEHLSYHDPSLDQGNYSIQLKNAGTGDNYLLITEGNAQYGMKIPGYRFEVGGEYQLDVKAALDLHATARSSATIHIRYHDGTTQKIVAPTVAYENWMIYKQPFAIEKEVIAVEIILNSNDTTVSGKCFFDYVTLVPQTFVDSANTEIHEI